jgi:branched-chain amino acid transport system substrate-binding protein
MKTMLSSTFATLSIFSLFVILACFVNPAEAAQGRISIGMVEAISGPFKASGDRFALGVKYAIDEINAKGGVLGKEVALVIEDSGFKADVAVRKATKLILEDKVDFLWGSLGSHVVLAMMKVAEKYKKVMVCANSEADSITGSDFNPYFFRTTPSTGQKAAAVVSYLAKHSKFKKYYILCMDFSLGREGGARFKESLKKKIPGAQLVGEDYHPLALKDFAPYVSKVIGSGAEVVLTTNYGPDLSNLIKAGGAFNWKAITAGGQLQDPVILREVNEAALGHLVATNTLIDLGEPEMRTFYTNFLEMLKQKGLDQVAFSPTMGIGSYSAIKWLCDVIKRAGTTDAEKVIKAWENASYDTLWGHVIMRACDHQIITPFKAGPIMRENEFFPFPYTGKLISIPKEDVAVAPPETGNPRCK